jgi:hypothetical protein
MRTPITKASLAKKDHYRAQVQLPEKWIQAVAHNFMKEALDTDLADRIRDAFAVRIQNLYLEHLATAVSTAATRAQLRVWLKANVPEDDLRADIIRKLRRNHVSV